MISKIPFIKSGWTISKNLLKKKYETFEGSFTEKIDVHLLTLIMETDDPRITSVMKTLLQKNIIDNVKPDGSLIVTHSNGQYKMGRYRAKHEVSMIPLSKYIKHTMFYYLGWCDIDMIKGHPTIAYEMAKGSGLELPAIKHYIDNFDSICETLIEYYSLENERLCKDDIKFLFILMIYGGTFSTWKSKIAETDDALGYKPRHIKNSDLQHALIQSFKFDCDKVIDKIWKDNPNLKISLKGDLTDTYRIKSRVTSYWFQAIENHILDIVYNFLINSNIMVPKTCGLEYDGLNIPVSLSPEQKIQITTDVNLRIAQETNLDIKMKFKEYGEFVITDLIEQRKAMTITDLPEVESDLSFSAVANQFELNHFKVINKSFFCKINGDGSVLIMNSKDLVTSYAHIPCERQVLVGNEYVTKTLPFIREWAINVNPDIRHYTDLQIYPKASSCPPDIYNLWIPFQAENIAEYVPNLEALAIIRNHIAVLCNHNPDVTEFIENWIAQMIQFPEIKNGCMPCFISDEGSGKGTLMALFHKMLGSAKVLETTDPERDVWGSFNSLMEQAFLVNLNEISTKNTMGSIGKIKGLITDPTIVINNKGIKQVVVNSFHRFIMTTNCDEPISTKQGDRRTLVIRSSDEKKGNTEYFDSLHELHNDFNVVKTCFDFFKAKDIQSFNFKKLPETDYQNELKDKNMHVYQQWLRDFVFCDSAMHSPSMTAGDMFGLFASWTRQNGVVFETNRIKMGLWFATHKFDGLTKTKTRVGATWTFDYEILANVPSLKF